MICSLYHIKTILVLHWLSVAMFVVYRDNEHEIGHLDRLSLNHLNLTELRQHQF